MHTALCHMECCFAEVRALTGADGARVCLAGWGPWGQVCAGVLVVEENTTLIHGSTHLFLFYIASIRAKIWALLTGGVRDIDNAYRHIGVSKGQKCCLGLCHVSVCSLCA